MTANAIACRETDLQPIEVTAKNSPFSDLADRFINFCERFAAPFRSLTHTREVPMRQYLSGLVQAGQGDRNMERMAEVVPESDDQALQHFVSHAEWDEREVLDRVALETDKHMGGQPDSCLIIDESGHPKKGRHSVGVSRQWCGNLGKVDNCQVGVYAALACREQVTLIDERLFLPQVWADDKARCLAAGIPEQEIVFKSKQEQALEMIGHARGLGVRFAWVGFDGFYGEDPALLRALQEQGEIFLGDVHKDQRIYLEDPKPVVPARKSKRGKAPTRRKAQRPSIRVDKWAAQQPLDAWQRMKLRDSTKGVLSVEILHRRVWVWDGEEENALCWHLIVRRDVDSPTTLKYSLSNAPEDTPAPRLAVMQGQRYWVERALQNGKQEVGLSDYQVRGWRAWHHHMALSMLAMLFMLEQRLVHQDTHPLLSCADIRTLLSHFLPRRDTTPEEVIRQMDQRHRKRQAAIEAAYRKQKNQ